MFVMPIMRRGKPWQATGAALLLTLALPGTDTAGQEPKTVVIEAMRFSPQALEVKAGDTIVWKNKDPFPHTVTAQDRSFDSGEIAPDHSWTYKAVKKGVFPYICTLHPSMKGSLTVK